MYGGFADSEYCGGGAHRRLVLDDVLSQRYRPLFDVPLQEATLPASLLLPSYAPRRVVMPAGTSGFFDVFSRSFLSLRRQSSSSALLARSEAAACCVVGLFHYLSIFYKNKYIIWIILFIWNVI